MKSEKNFIFIKRNDKISFSFENGLFYSTKSLKKNKAYHVEEILVNKWEKKYLESSGIHDMDPVREVKIRNEKGKFIWVSLTDKDKVNDIKIIRKQFLKYVLDK